MAQIIQIRRDSAANWELNNPILAEGEIGYELSSGNLKIGDGITHWHDLSYKVFNIKGDKGDTGTGLSRTTSSTIDFQTEKSYVEKTITDALILSTSVIIVQPQGEEYAIQGVNCGVVSITQGVGYTIYGAAPDGASDVMTINILIF